MAQCWKFEIGGWTPNWLAGLDLGGQGWTLQQHLHLRVAAQLAVKVVDLLATLGPEDNAHGDVVTLAAMAQVESVFVHVWHGKMSRGAGSVSVICDQALAIRFFFRKQF